LQEALDLDSIDFLNFVVGLHEATGLEIPERDYPLLSTVEGCLTYLTSAA
jgi:acyl carrier protein